MSALTSVWTLAIAMFAVPLVSHTEAQAIASALLPLPEVLRGEAAVVQLEREVLVARHDSSQGWEVKTWETRQA